MRITIVVTIWLCTLGVHADARALRAQQVARVLAGAERALEAGQPERAKKQLRAAVQRQPGEALLLARYASLLLPFEQDVPWPAQPERAASELLTQVARAHSVSGDALAAQDPESERQVALHAALAEAVLGRFEPAFNQLVEAGRLQDASTLHCLRKLATLAVQREQLLEAEQALGLARQYMPQDRALPSELGRVLLARGKIDVAVSVLAEQLAIDPSSLHARADLAYAMTAQGRAGEALALLDAVREACAKERACALVAARIALEGERPREALSYVRVWASERDLDALFVLADASLRAGDKDTARGAYQQVLSVRPESVRARQGLEQLPAP